MKVSKKIRYNNTILAPTYRAQKSLFEKGIGLMFQNKVETPLVFFFNKPKIIQLHMYFVFTPIDVVFGTITKQSNTKLEIKIVELVSQFKPWTTYTPKNNAQIVIELAPNSIKKYRITKNKTMTIER